MLILAPPLAPRLPQVRQAQQMANVVTKKREEIMAKLERLQRKKEGLDEQYERMAARDDGAPGQEATVSEEVRRCGMKATGA